MSKFSIPVSVPTDNKYGEPYSPLTIKVYEQHLNRLAKAGFSTVTDLLNRPSDVLKTIEEFVGENSAKARASRRKFLSAIMYVLPESYKAGKNPYYDSFQTAKDGYESSDRPKN